MQTIDFTDQLTATLTDVDRRQIIKFNNSWLLLEKDKNAYTYLVAYRALVFKNRYEDGEWRFAEPAPQDPGQSGTPWGEGWNVLAKGQALCEACVPVGRRGRYFDGIGLARVQLTFGLRDNPDASFKVLGDEILKNSDGYEDPRLFRDGDAIYLHCHRLHPDIARRSQNMPSQKSGSLNLCVKILKLKFDGKNYELGNEFFYGLNKSTNIEKNYGFFFDNKQLNAVYALTKNGAGYCLFETDPDPFKSKVSGSVIEVKSGYPNSLETIDTLRECFLRLEDYFKNSIPLINLQLPVQFSSSSPLLSFAPSKWIGVGHVKLHYDTFYRCINILITYAKDLFQWNERTDLSVFNELWADNVKLEGVIWKMANDPVHQEKIARFDAKYAAVFQNIIKCLPDFFQNDVFKLVSKILLNPKSVFRSNQGAPLENPVRQNAGKIVLHKDYVYLNFLYEIESKAKEYKLTRFSDCFLLTPDEEPAALQFATSLATTKGGYLMSFGENDHRAKIALMTNDELDGLLHHDACHFSVKDYGFKILSPGSVSTTR